MHIWKIHAYIVDCQLFRFWETGVIIKMSMLSLIWMGLLVWGCIIIFINAFFKLFWVRFLERKFSRRYSSELAHTIFSKFYNSLQLLKQNNAIEPDSSLLEISLSDKIKTCSKAKWSKSAMLTWNFKMIACASSSYISEINWSSINQILITTQMKIQLSNNPKFDSQYSFSFFSEMSQYQNFW